MAIQLYFVFNGNCREAVEFYAKVFKTEEPNIMSFGDAPPDPNHTIPEEAKHLVMHANLEIAGSKVMFSDTWPGSPFTVGNNITIAVVSEDEELIRSAFDGLKEGGKVNMELQETFWSKCYGQVVDKFGIEWQLSLESKEQ
ncbi:VOC family protein [Lysinibacillus halotolerans]|uniref:VOC family protein n=1 Tax=Lysinibacillus halotolerans TaxID=1368476 RepID=A0A3M8HF21_9BACI|nr:VOC family protein [Lysinibacillus halotolerans]RND00651.1 VOC family protein [Lysinibacillus halotolerans]